MKTCALLAAAILSLAPVISQRAPVWTTQARLKLEDGNALYSDCQAWRKNMTNTSGHRIMVASTADPEAIYAAGSCWGYILAVVDSIPAGEGFQPASSVRATQYIDVVTDYLRDHPQSRNSPAYFLVRESLSKAFQKTSAH